MLVLSAGTRQLAPLDRRQTCKETRGCCCPHREWGRWMGELVRSRDYSSGKGVKWITASITRRGGVFYSLFAYVLCCCVPLSLHLCSRYPRKVSLFIQSQSACEWGSSTSSCPCLSHPPVMSSFLDNKFLEVRTDIITVYSQNHTIIDS